MSHERMKDGERKDKKNARMREAVAERKEHGSKEEHKSDQSDIQDFKPGGADDRNMNRGLE